MSVNIRLTRQGKKVLAQGLLGEEIHFTRVIVGDGAFDYETESVYEMTALKSPQMVLPLVEEKIIGDGTVYLKAYLSNAELNHGFECKEHGIFAIDQETGEEILYAFKNDGEEYCFIPSNTGSVKKNVFVSYVVEIQDAENVTAMLDLSVAYINVTDFEEHINSTAPHPNTPTKKDDVETTAEIWCSDNDSHLHKIKIENLRELLKSGEVADEKLDVQAIQNELGLSSANVLMIEDFKSDDVTDYFKSKVRSYAEHGNLLGIDTPKNLKTGGLYILSDGVGSELVTVETVLKNEGGYYARLESPVANTYQTANLYLYRTTPAPCNKNSLTWHGANFSGVRANISRTLELENYIDIQGDGFIADDFLVLG